MNTTKLTDTTLATLLGYRFTLNEVDNWIHNGWISEDLANEWFKIWAVGKIGHRWNETLKRPEHLICDDIYTGAERWVEMRWG